DYVLLQKGYNGKYTFNFAAQYKNNFNVGFNLNSHVIDYRRSTLLTERNNSPNSTVNYVFFENNLNTLGSGFSAQIGAIAKLPGALRIGLTYDTPVWYTIAEETSQYLETDRTENGQTITTVVNPNVVNVFADYRLRTPARLGASAAYVFGAHGLLSFDYSYKDYSGITFGPGNDASFSALNVAIENNLKPVSTYSIGGEYRAGNFSLRAGLRHEESPFADGATVGGLTGYSAGLGYNFGNYSFDASYSHAEQDRNEQLYTIGLTAPARVAARYDSVLFTLGISL
ncbi:MAG: OmpP1/FadL family transporter, partial [Marinirhabdus sp.]